MTAATILQTASQTVGMFIGARFLSMWDLWNHFSVRLLTRKHLVGFGLTFCANAAPLLVSEVAYPSQRAALTSTYNSLWYVVILTSFECTTLLILSRYAGSIM